MKMARVFCLSVLFLFGGAIQAQTRESVSLKNLSGFYVEITIQGSDAESSRVGLTEQQLRTDTELRLRKAGIRVLTESQMANSSPSPRLTVFVQLYRSTDQRIASLYAFSVAVEASQYVTLQNSFHTLATTWSVST